MKEILNRFITLEPTKFRSVIAGAIGLLVILGVKIIPGIDDAILNFWIPLQVVIQAILIRPAVTANARVVVEAPDPISEPSVVAPGEATTTASDAKVLAAAKEVPRG